jgi:hypothetical protein
MIEHQSETIGKIAAALSKAQATMGVALKDSTNPHFRSKYADLTSIITASRDALTSNDLAVLQRAQPHERGVQIQTTIVHSSGEWISDAGLFLPAAKLDPQGFGSAATYCRRYGLAAMLGIVQDDDDGNAASAPRVAAAPAQSAVQAITERFDATPAPATESDSGDDYVFKFGKHKGTSIREVPGTYLDWLLAQPAKDGFEEQHAEQHAMFRRELARREAVV